MDLFWFYLFFSIGFNIFLFIPAFIYKTDKLTDMSYALTFGVISTLALVFSSQDPVQKILWLAIILWSIRLGGFLLMRVMKKGKDVRFDGMRENFWRFLRFWLLQGASVFIIMVSSILLWQTENTTTSLLSWVGLAIFATGLALEATADLQKFSFSENPKNKDKWIEQGVWKISRHPNYLGEMMVWVGLYLFGFNTLSSTDRLIGLISPLFIICLLLFISGVPLLEKSADKKWGRLKEYANYKKRVPKLFPFGLFKKI